MNKIALVGKPNVGKSSLFNRLIGKRQALITEIPGTTRDINQVTLKSKEKEILLIDTAGYDYKKEDPLAHLTDEHFQKEIDMSDFFIFVADGKTGITREDQILAEFLRKHNKETILVVNKSDLKGTAIIQDFYKLGFGEPLPVSAIRGSGIVNLKKKIFDFASQEKEANNKEKIKISIVGRPNVGKTSFLNKLIGDKKYIVSNIPGTTRDINAATVEYENHDIIFLDTAGLRKRGKIGRAGQNIIEKFSAERTREAIKESDICLLIVDAPEKITSQDLHIAGEIKEEGKGIIIIINKWDLAESFNHSYDTVESFTALAKNRFEFLPYAPIVFVSSESGKNINKVLELILKIKQRRATRIKTGEFNTFLAKALKDAPSKINAQKIKFGQQVEIDPPTFIFFTSCPGLIHFSFRRFLENRIREKWDFSGTPIKLFFKAKK